MVRRARVLLAVAAGAACSAAVAVAACVPSYSFTGGTDGGVDAAAPPGPDATAGDGSASDSGAGHDAAIDAPPDVPPVAWGDGAPVIVANPGAKVRSTGFGEQLHVIYAQNDRRFWLFYVDDNNGFIQTRASVDLVTWTSEQSASLGSATVLDGNNFSVGYANVSGADVVHIAANTVPAGGGYATVDVRAVIAGGALTASVPQMLPNTTAGGGCDWDAPIALVRSDGRVYEVTAWSDHSAVHTGCDTNIFRSTALDTGGASWTSGFDYDGYYVSVPDHAYTHDLVDLPNTGLVLALWPDEDYNTDVTLMDTVDWALSNTWDGGAPDATGVFPVESEELFYGMGQTAGSNDWAACRLTDQEVHLVRHVAAVPPDAAAPRPVDAAVVATFQELVFGGVIWQPGSSGAPPAVPSPADTGVVLVSDANPAHGFILATVGTDDSIDMTKWTSAGGWVALPPVPGSAQRQSLAGTGCGSERPALFWVEGTGSYAIMSMDVGALLGP
jgi:hypothetical protein